MSTQVDEDNVHRFNADELDEVMASEDYVSRRSSIEVDNLQAAMGGQIENKASEESSLVQNEVMSFKPEVESEGRALQKSPSRLERIQTSLSFFNPHFKNERVVLVKQYMGIYLFMIACILGIFSIYWGSAYQRFSRLPNLKMLVVIEDEAINGVEPYIGNTLRSIIESPTAQKLGGWDIVDLEEFNKSAQEYNNTVKEEITRQIHHQLYWTSIYVPKNASYTYKQYIEGNENSINATDLIYSIYETGRDFMNMNSYVTPQVQKIEKMWLSSQEGLTQLFNESESFTINQVRKLTEAVTFVYEDKIPYTDPVLSAPSQVGLIYIIIITFFTVNSFADINQRVSQMGLKFRSYILFRICSSYMSYFFLSLGYSLVTLAFQVDFTPAFGRSGFLVYWMCSYITMIAVGLMNEVAFMVLLMYFPPFVGFWLLFWVLINISSTFAPIALCPEFYRFGYAMPVHNSFELTKVIFFNTYKGQMGRNIGILFAWIVFDTIAFCLLLKPFGKKMKQKAIAKAKDEQAQKAAKEKAEQEKFEA